MHDSTRHFPAVDGSAVVAAIAYTVPEAAAQIGMSARHLDRLIKAGDLPIVPIGRLKRVLHSDLLAFMEARRETAKKAA